jgi:two-component system LytT family sensor kinase
LSGLMRYALDESGSNFVPLKKEIDHLHDFIGLASMRYAPHEISVNFSVNGDIENTMITPMILLPFVENAFKYGVKIGETSSIDIGITVTNTEIKFHCQNTVMAQHGMESSGIGLINVKRRLELLYPAKADLEIIDTGAMYTVNLLLK